MPTDPRVLIFPAALMLYGLLYLIFAFKEPSEYLQNWFKIPIIFVVLPGRVRQVVGRFATGVLLVASAAWFYNILV